MLRCLIGLRLGCRLVIPTLLVAMMLPVAAAKLPKLQKDPKGQIPLLIPKGWSVQGHHQEDIGIMSATENATPTSPSLGLLVLKRKGQASVQMVVNQLVGMVQGANILRRAELPQGLAMSVAGRISNVPARLALMVIADPKSQMIYAGFFAAPEARFKSLGGEDLLVASLQMQMNPFRPAPALRPAMGQRGKVNVLAYEDQLALLNARQRTTPTAIHGTWSNGVSAPGSSYKEVVSGTVKYSSIGRGTHITFRKDGKYTFLRHYSQSFMHCQNSKMTAVEHGSYTFDGWTLVLKPRGVKGESCLCSCDPATRWKRKRTKDRTYEVALAPGGKGLVIRGDCPEEYPLGCVGAEPRKFLREGLFRK